MIPKPPRYYKLPTSEIDDPHVWFEPSAVWEIKCADLSISPKYFAAVGHVRFVVTGWRLVFCFPRRRSSHAFCVLHSCATYKLWGSVPFLSMLYILCPKLSARVIGGAGYRVCRLAGIAAGRHARRFMASFFFFVVFDWLNIVRSVSLRRSCSPSSQSATHARRCGSPQATILRISQERICCWNNPVVMRKRDYQDIMRLDVSLRG